MSRRRNRRMAARAAVPSRVAQPDTVATAAKSVTSTWPGAQGTWQTLTDLFGLQGLAAPASLPEALTNESFLLCADVMAQDIGKSTLRMFEKIGDDRRREVRPGEHQIADLLADRPNEYHTWGDWKDMVLRYFAIAQNAFIAKQITTRGDIRALIPVIPGRVQIMIDTSSGELFYDVSRGTQFELAALRAFPMRLPQEKMIHVKGRLYDGLNGFSSLVAGTGALQLAKAIQTYQDRLYSGGGRYKVAFLMNEDQELSPEAYERLARQFAQAHRNTMESDKPLILENGADVKTLMMTAQESEIAIAQKNAITSVCRLFRMPPHKVMHFDGIKYENMDSAERMYVSDSLVPTARRFEEALALSLFTREERSKYVLEFDRDEMAAVDVKTRAEIAKIGVQTGILNADEGRRELGYDPLPNDQGKVRAIPVNVTLVDEKNKPVLEGRAGAPGDNSTADPLQQPAKDPPAKRFTVVSTN